jgi:hypothetical protein
MKRMALCFILFTFSTMVFAKEKFPFIIVSYVIHGVEVADQYSYGEIILNDDEETLEFVLYSTKNKVLENIFLDDLEEGGEDGIFHTVLLQGSTSIFPENLYALVTIDDDDFIVRICNKDTDELISLLTIRPRD